MPSDPPTARTSFLPNRFLTSLLLFSFIFIILLLTGPWGGVRLLAVIIAAVLILVRGKGEDDEPCPDCGDDLDYIDNYDS